MCGRRYRALAPVILFGAREMSERMHERHLGGIPPSRLFFLSSCHTHSIDEDWIVEAGTIIKYDQSRADSSLVLHTSL